MVGWQRHFQSILRQVRKRLEHSSNALVNFSGHHSRASLVPGELPYLRILRSSSSLNNSRPLYQYWQQLQFSCLRELLAISSDETPISSPLNSNCAHTPLYPPSRSFCSHPLNLDGSEGPATIDYSSVGFISGTGFGRAFQVPALMRDCCITQRSNRFSQEEEFHKLADSTIHDLLEKLEEYGDSVDMDGFDIDYGNQVLTLKLGTLGTYVVNKQTPNRQIWMSSPVSGPARFDWDRDAQTWVYRRTKSNLFKVLESELEQLCGQPINLS